MLSEDCGKFVDCEKTTKQKYRKPDKNKVSGFFLFLSGFEPLAFRLGGGRSILLSYRNAYKILMGRIPKMCPQ